MPLLCSCQANKKAMQQQIILNGIPPEDFWSTMKTIVEDALSSTSMSKSENFKSILTIKTASQFTGLSASKLYNLTSSKKIPHLKKGGKVLFNRDDLTKWLMESKVEAHDN
jgi:excisionase family DNA binding protein